MNVWLAKESPLKVFFILYQDAEFASLDMEFPIRGFPSGFPCSRLFLKL